MESNGAYNQYAQCQVKVVYDSEPVLNELATRFNKLAHASDETIVFVDLGCSQGRNSQSLLTFLLSRLNLSANDCMIYLNDQKSNDWNSLVNEFDIKYNH